jgi:hypothetical protein
MTLIVENGTGMSTAESYISVADATSYHSDRGNINWGLLTVQQQEQALRRATDHMLGEYRNRWNGSRVTSTQYLDWPRLGVIKKDSQGANGVYGMFVVPQSIVPVEVKNACAELAIRAAAGPLREDLTQAIVREKIGPLDTTYDKATSEQTRYSDVDAMLRVLLRGGGNSSMVKLIRT